MPAHIVSLARARKQREDAIIRTEAFWREIRRLDAKVERMRDVAIYLSVTTFLLGMVFGVAIS